VAALLLWFRATFRKTRPLKEFSMTLKSLKPLLAGATVATMLAFAAACSGTASSMTPTAPTAAANSAAAGANFSPNPECPVPRDPVTGECPPPPPPPTCETDPSLCPPPEGIPCSPGYWKNHEAAFATSCGPAAALPGDPFTTCDDLLTALTCKGSDASCGRHLASGALNTVSGCTESD
jgi:hypothetical protein